MSPQLHCPPCTGRCVQGRMCPQTPPGFVDTQPGPDLFADVGEPDPMGSAIVWLASVMGVVVLAALCVIAVRGFA